jgi:hypothetical protein
MRSITHVAAAELAKRIKGNKWAKYFYGMVVNRPDDITEIISYYFNNHGKNLPKCLKKGLALAFRNFDKYQIAKYRGTNANVKLVDVVNLVHPKPTSKNSEALKELINNDLRSFNTWESELTKAGQKAKNKEELEELKKDAWNKLIKERKIGYFALLRNLRNILEQAPELVNDACNLLVDEKLIKKSLVLPFRFNTAIEEIKKMNSIDARTVIKAINEATEISLNNVPKFDGRTLIAVDDSGSMTGWSNNPKTPIKIASLFASVIGKTNNADILLFSDNGRHFNYNPNDTIQTIREQIESNLRGCGTNFNAIFDTANKPYDRIIILSDMQGWMGKGYCIGGAPTKSFSDYKKKFGTNPIVYSFDLQGYGSLQFPERNVYCLTGFSDKVFDIMKLLETDKQALINKIEEMDFKK